MTTENQRTHMASARFVRDIRERIKRFQKDYGGDIKREVIDWQYIASLKDMLDILNAMEHTIPLSERERAQAEGDGDE